MPRSETLGRRPLRLAILTNLLSPYRLKLFESMVGLVENLRVLTMARTEWNREWDTDCRSIDVRQLRGVHLKAPGRESEVHFNLGVSKELALYKPDIVMSGGLSQAVYSAARWSRSNSVPHVTWGELRLDQKGSVNPARRMLRREIVANSVFAIGSNSASVAGFVELGFSPEFVKLSLLASELHLLPKWKPRSRNKSDALRIAVIGQLIPRKGHLNLINTLCKIELLSGLRFEVWLFGSGPLESSISEAATASGIDLRSFGHVDFREIGPHLRACDFSVFPSLFETHGLVIQESLSVGVPTIASSRASAAPEFIIHGETGWLYDPLGPDAPSQLREVFEMPEKLLIQVASRGHAAAQAWTIDDSARDLVSTLRKVRSRHLNGS